MSIQYLSLIHISVMTLLRIPAGAWDETRAYLRVVLLGVCFTFLYNYFACLLRSVGNLSLIHISPPTRSGWGRAPRPAAWRGCS